MANFKPYNRYTNGIITTDRSGNNFLVLRQPLKLEVDNTDVLVTLNQNLITRPDLISYKAYGTTDFWWVIMEYNNIIDPLLDLKIGMILKIPELNRVIAAINKLGTE